MSRTLKLKAFFTFCILFDRGCEKEYVAAMLSGGDDTTVAISSPVNGQVSPHRVRQTTETIGLLGVSTQDVAASSGPELTKALRKQLKSQGDRYTLQEPSGDLSDTLVLAGCRRLDNDCAQQIGDMMGVKKAVWGHIEEHDGVAYFSVGIVDVATGAIEVFVSDKIPEVQLSTKISAVAAKAFQSGASAVVEESPKKMLAMAKSKKTRPATVAQPSVQQPTELASPKVAMVVTPADPLPATAPALDNVLTRAEPDLETKEPNYVPSFLAFGGGVVGIGVATLLGVIVKGKEKSFQEEYAQGGPLHSTNGASDPRLAMMQGGEQMALGANVALGVAGAAIVTGVVTMITEYVDSH